MVTNVAVRQVLLAQNAKTTLMNAQARLARTTDTVLTRRMAINATVSLPLRGRTARQVFLQACNIYFFLPLLIVLSLKSSIKGVSNKQKIMKQTYPFRCRYECIIFVSSSISFVKKGK